MIFVWPLLEFLHHTCFFFFQIFSNETISISITICIRRPVGSTNQAYPSCFYFRISWILMGQRYFYIIYSDVGVGRHDAGSGQLAQNSWICRFADLLLDHPEIPIARLLDHSHPGLLGKYHGPTLSLTVVLQLLVHSFSRTDPVCHLPLRKPKVPAIRQTSSKVLKKYMVT